MGPARPGKAPQQKLKPHGGGTTKKAAIAKAKAGHAVKLVKPRAIPKGAKHIKAVKSTKSVKEVKPTRNVKPARRPPVATGRK